VASAQPNPIVHPPTELCPSCSTDLAGRFCHQCGEKKFHQHDLAVKHFLQHALDEFTHLDSKVFATLRYLFSRPGYLTLEYTSGRKSKYMKPLSLFLLAVALMFLADSIHPRSVYNITFLNQNDKAGTLDTAWNKLAAKKHMPKQLLLYRFDGFKPVKFAQAPVGRWSQGIAFSRDGSTILVQNMLEKDIQVFRLHGTTLTDTGQRIKLSGGGAAMRTAKY